MPSTGMDEIPVELAMNVQGRLQEGNKIFNLKMHVNELNYKGACATPFDLYEVTS